MSHLPNRTKRKVLRSGERFKYRWVFAYPMLFDRLKREKNVCVTCADTLDKLTKRVAKLESESLDHYTASEALRDKVLRKIQGKREEKAEDSNSTSILVPE